MERFHLLIAADRLPALRNAVRGQLGEIGALPEIAGEARLTLCAPDADVLGWAIEVADELGGRVVDDTGDLWTADRMIR